MAKRLPIQQDIETYTSVLLKKDLKKSSVFPNFIPNSTEMHKLSDNLKPMVQTW